MRDKDFFPDIIKQHPEAEIPIDCVESKLVQAGDQQFIFMEFNDDVEIPPHKHNAQWGVVLDGEIELTINDDIKLLTKGDSYFIDKDVVHSARIKAGYKDLTLFNQKDRYTVK
ncbi:MAG: cupin domain-containing protein [Bacteroidales bacterium]|jgi:quercetin dioxygenase-like cupin family protein|nr:cupin domain-containing protein [Bacteroidales bacterium]